MNRLFLILLCMAAVITAVVGVSLHDMQDAEAASLSLSVSPDPVQAGTNLYATISGGHPPYTVSIRVMLPNGNNYPAVVVTVPGNVYFPVPTTYPIGTLILVWVRDTVGAKVKDSAQVGP